MDELTVASAVPTSKRFRFGLRAIFTLMLVIAVGICFYKLGYRRGVESMKLSSALYVQTYDVHDLVTPKQGTADFAPLMNIIQATIRPHSWEDTGGSFSIHEFPFNLSLIISADDRTHEEISELINRVRLAKGQ
jgi:hypothetical protein